MKFNDLVKSAAQRPATREELEAWNSIGEGFHKLMGLSFTACGPDGVQAELQVGPEHLQMGGVVNGGVYCGIAETVGSVAGLIQAPGHIVMGVNNSTDFIAPVAGGVIEARSYCLQSGRRTQLFEVRMTQNGRLVARTTLRTMVTTATHSSGTTTP